MILELLRVPHASRHPMVLQAYALLPPGGSFELVNDHDPAPVSHLLRRESRGRASWEYLERGPRRWRVRIGKPPAHPSPEPSSAT